MAALLQTLSGNPLQTAIGQKIEQATESSLPSEDWASFLEICDMINDTDEGPKDAARAIKRRLQQNAGKNHVTVMYTLTLLETCVKNCGKRFHTLVTSKDFVQDLVKLIGPRNDPPPVLQEKVLNLIQTWSEAFRGQPECSGVVQVYNELKSKKVEFPVSDLDSTPPIHTPQRSVPPYQRKVINESSVTTTGSTINTNISTFNRPASAAPLNTINSTNNTATLAAAAAINPASATSIGTFHAAMSGPVNLTSEQLVKLRSELDVVQGNMKVFHEMVNELVPGKEHQDDWTLLRDLNATCQAMQKRIVELIEKVANEEVTNELLRVNDELNNLFERFERYERKRNNSSSVGADLASAAPISTVPKTKLQEPSLIDLSADESEPTDLLLSKGIQGISLNKDLKATPQPRESAAAAIGDADFDFFAQSRSSNLSGTRTEPKTTLSNQDSLGLDQIEIALHSGNSPRGVGDSLNGEGKPLPLDSERDLVEMEKWLRDQHATSNASQGGDFSFEKFLAERADASDKTHK